MAEPIEDHLRKRLELLLFRRQAPETEFIRWIATARDEMFKVLGCDEELLLKRIYVHVRDGERIDKVDEKRPDWLDFEHHYDMRFMLLKKQVYVETRLLLDKEDDLTFVIASVHEGWR